jgi:hypothetical protein
MEKSDQIFEEDTTRGDGVGRLQPVVAVEQILLRISFNE